jgi:peptidyl-prolyl cis-trans isomerase D
MLRVMRENAKWIFYILAFAFVGWLVFDVGMDVTGGGQYGGADVVLRVNGRAVHIAQYQAALQAAYDQYKSQGGGSLTREDEQQISDQVVKQLVQQLLLQQEYGRLGITVTAEEVIQAARSSPPAEIMNAPEFQTNGQFDISKWQRFLASGSDPRLLQALEARYREQIPQVKLAQYLTADVYVSDGKLWRVYRDQHEAVTVALLALRPEQIADADVPVSEAELQRYYQAHANEFRQRAVAYLSYVAVSRVPDARDSAAALGRARTLRAAAAQGLARFEEVAKRKSADSVSGAKGGDLGWIRPESSGFDPLFLKALTRLAPGQVSPPVLTSFGYHLIRLDAARGDSVRVRHILAPVALQGAHLDAVDARADSLDRLAAERADPAALDSAARRLNLRVERAPELPEGERLLLGRWVVPDVSVWAFEGRAPGETSPVIEGEGAYYVFRLDSLTPARVPALAEVRDRVLQHTRHDRKKELARQRAEALAERLAGTRDLLRAGAAAGVPTKKLGPFTRLRPPPELGAEPVVLGAAFGLRPGEVSRLVAGQTGYFVVQALARVPADSAAWLTERVAQREAMLEQARQARIQAYMLALRAQAKVVDRRKEIFRPQSATGA